MRGGGASGEGREGRGVPARRVRAVVRGRPTSVQSRALAPSEAANARAFRGLCFVSLRWEGS